MRNKSPCIYWNPYTRKREPCLTEEEIKSMWPYNLKKVEIKVTENKEKEIDEFYDKQLEEKNKQIQKLEAKVSELTILLQNKGVYVDE